MGWFTKKKVPALPSLAEAEIDIMSAAQIVGKMDMRNLSEPYANDIKQQVEPLLDRAEKIVETWEDQTMENQVSEMIALSEDILKNKPLEDIFHLTERMTPAEQHQRISGKINQLGAVCYIMRAKLNYNLGVLCQKRDPNNANSLFVKTYKFFASSALGMSKTYWEYPEAATLRAEIRKWCDA